MQQVCFSVCYFILSLLLLFKGTINIFISFYCSTCFNIYWVSLLGKTTITYRLKLGDVVTTIPTIGFNVETIQYKKLQMTMWDIGGQDKIRPLWRHYFVNTSGLIFVIDSNDRYLMFINVSLFTFVSFHH